jgi:hypothetical protein
LRFEIPAKATVPLPIAMAVLPLLLLGGVVVAQRRNCVALFAELAMLLPISASAVLPSPNANVVLPFKAPRT